MQSITTSSSSNNIHWTDKDILLSNTFNPMSIQNAFLQQLSKRSEWTLQFFWSAFYTHNDKRYLLCGASNGYVYGYEFGQFQSSIQQEPVFKFHAHNGSIHCYTWVPQPKVDNKDEFEQILFTGGDQEVRAWNISEIIQQNTLDVNVQPWKELIADEQYVSERKATLERVECNAICYDANNDKLFTAWGDGCIYVWDVESGTLLSKYVFNQVVILKLIICLELEVTKDLLY
jgi:WD40 repeat protein